MPARSLESVSARVQRLPDPTILFLALAALILGIKVAREDLLKTWPARLLFPPALLASVFAAALWRRPTARRKNDHAPHPPPGILPNPRKLVARGAALRARDADVALNERKLRKAQLKLEMLRKDIMQRLPSNSAVAERAPAEDTPRRANTADDTVQISF